MAKKLASVRTAQKRALSLALLLVGIGAGVGCRSAPPTAADDNALVVTVRSEPRTFNGLLATDRVSLLLSTLTMGSLVRINGATQEVEPWLAERWTVSSDGREWTLALRSATFADGTPFRAADVVFTANALYDERTASPLAQTLLLDGKRLTFTAVDDSTVKVTLPAPYGPGLRILASLPILPKHLLEPRYVAGDFRGAWGLDVAPAALVGLGPFRLREYVPGQRVVLERNPHYWRVDASGARLPYLDRLQLDIVPDQNTEMLRLQSARADVVTGEVPPEELVSVRRLAEGGRLQLRELGVSLDPDFLWVNLAPARRAAGGRRAWLFADDFRRAISSAVDREAFVRTVLLGAGTPTSRPITSGNKRWYHAGLSDVAHDPASARRVLASLGLSDRDGDGMLETADGEPVAFTLVTQQGHALRDRAAGVLQQDLAAVGVRMAIAKLDAPALVARFQSGDYDAALFGAQASDTDPAANVDFWLSSGAFHFWNPGQSKPASTWEARIDSLMKDVVTLPDFAARKARFDEVQAIFADVQPVLYFGAPIVHVALGTRVENASLGLLQPYVMWNADSLRVKGH